MSDKPIRFYWSSFTSTVKIQKDITFVRSLLDAHARDSYEDINIADEDLKERRNEMRTVDGKRDIPQVFVLSGGDWTYLGNAEELEMQNEEGTLKPALQNAGSA